jgi:hypothetical protein
MEISRHKSIFMNGRSKEWNTGKDINSISSWANAVLKIKLNSSVIIN